MALADLVDLVLPRECGGCGCPAFTWCPDCAGELAHVLTAQEPAPIVLAGRPGLRVWWGAPFREPLRTAVSAYKDRGRTDLLPVLVPLLRRALAAAVRDEPSLATAVRADARIDVVPVPSSRAAGRRRGRAPVVQLAHAAVRDLPGFQVRPLVRPARRVADQSGLHRAERVRNLAGAHVAVPAPLPGLPVLLLDDVVTTGATLGEAARALRAAGWAPLLAVTAAAASPGDA